MYERGYRVGVNNELALEWFGRAFDGVKQSAEAGDVRAQFFLARMYYNGHAAERDFALAAELYRKAAEQGNMQAQYNLDTGRAGLRCQTRASADWHGRGRRRDGRQRLDGVVCGRDI